MLTAIMEKIRIRRRQQLSPQFMEELKNGQAAQDRHYQFMRENWPAGKPIPDALREPTQGSLYQVFGNCHQITTRRVDGTFCEEEIRTTAFGRPLRTTIREYNKAGRIVSETDTKHVYH